MNDQDLIAKLLALSANDALSEDARAMLHTAANRLTALRFSLSKHESLDPPA